MGISQMNRFWLTQDASLVTDVLTLHGSNMRFLTISVQNLDQCFLLDKYEPMF